MKVQFLCPAPDIVSNFTPPIKKTSVTQIKVKYPVKITSISRQGAVEVQFF